MEPIDDDTKKCTRFQDMRDFHVRGKSPPFEANYEEVAWDTTLLGNGLSKVGDCPPRMDVEKGGRKIPNFDPYPYGVVLSGSFRGEGVEVVVGNVF